MSWRRPRPFRPKEASPLAAARAANDDGGGGDGDGGRGPTTMGGGGGECWPTTLSGNGKFALRGINLNEVHCLIFFQANDRIDFPARFN